LERIVTQSDGNAFFAEELVAAGLIGDDRRVPPKLRDVLMARMEALSENAKRVVRVAATAGRRVDHRLVELVARLPDQQLLRGLRDAVDHQIIVSDTQENTYVFRHALMRETVYADLLPGERMVLHAAIAEVLEAHSSLASIRGPMTAVELAHHWNAASNHPKALAAAVEAGWAAANSYAFAEAHRQMERALELWNLVPDVDRRGDLQRSDLLERAAESARWAGEIRRAIQLLRLALDEIDLTHEPIEAAALYERLGRYLWEAGDGEHALAAHNRARR
jgi:predicted ATPase